ncbi:MAG TPA: hypothetical protein VEB65_02380 [Solirubrobacterales bacterium]|nr:hypothetical protein [Solirubrobacterales bacterium]
MRKGLTLTVWLVALIALTCAGFASAAGEGPVKVKVGELEFSANTVFSPKAGSRTKQTPIKIQFEGEIGMADGSHPPALKEVIIEADKNGSVNAKGIPTCSGGQLQSRDTKAAEAACRDAIIGEGKTTVEVQFPEQQPVLVNSKLLLVNGGVSGGTTTWYVHAYFNAPITGAIVTTVKIKKHRNGRYGTLSVASVPKIAGGAGSVRSFQLTIDKNVKGADGKTYHPVTGKCTDGKAQFHSEAVFTDGTKAAAEIIRTCTPKP